MAEPIVSISEARDLLGDDAIGMSDEQILEVIHTLDRLAQDTIEEAKRKLRIKNDAGQLAELLYDIYQDKKRLGSSK